LQEKIIHNDNFFQRRLQDIFETSKLTQSAFAGRIGIKQPALNNLLTGRSQTPSIQTLQLLRAEFNVSPLWLLTGEGEMFLSVQRQTQVRDAKAMVQTAMQAQIQRKANPEVGRAMEVLQKNPKLAKLVEKLGLLGEEKLGKVEGYVDGLEG
jgi:transcriptional regulator with XRE-family HTH domain